MKFEDLQRVWREPATGNFKRVRIEDLSAARERAGSYLNHEMRIGMPLLTILIVVAIPWFATAAISAPRPLLAWPGAVLLSGWILSITAVWWKLWKARPNPGLPVRDAVHIELERLRTMQRFRSNIRWIPPRVCRRRDSSVRWTARRSGRERVVDRRFRRSGATARGNR